MMKWDYDAYLDRKNGLSHAIRNDVTITSRLQNQLKHFNNSSKRQKNVREKVKAEKIVRHFGPLSKRLFPHWKRAHVLVTKTTRHKEDGQCLLCP